MINKKIRFALVSGLAMGGLLSSPMFGLASQQSTSTTTTLSTQSSASPSYLYVVSAGKGQIEPLNRQGSYRLKLNLPAVDQVIEFSDRPERIVKYITGSDLNALWKQGTNSFKDTPPNAVLSSVNDKPVIVVLSKEKINQSRIEFEFTSTRHLPKSELHHVVLTIDGSTFCLPGGSGCYNA
jgi:hypothetical protein